MNNNEKTNNNFEDLVKNSYQDIPNMDDTFKKNLDKLVANTIRQEKLRTENMNQKQSRGLFRSLFSGVRWQVSLLSTFIVVLLFGGVAFAAIPEVREIIIPSKGELYINSIPEGVEVEALGGKYTSYAPIGITPLNTTLEAGNYNIRLSKEGYEDYQREITILKGDTSSYEIQLKEIVSVVDNINEWKTYTDLEDGFELTYPLDWKVSDRGEENLIISFESDQNLLEVRNIELNSITFEEETFNDKSYKVNLDSNKWNFIFNENYISEDQDSTIYVYFYTQEKSNIKLFDFISNSIKVFKDSSVVEEPHENTFLSERYDFKFQYPDSLYVVQKQQSDYYGEFTVVDSADTSRELRIIYSPGYLEELNEYKENGTREINNTEVKEYINTFGSLIFEYPNRLFIVIPENINLDDSSAFSEVVNSMISLSPQSYDRVSNYQLGHSIILPANWDYNTSLTFEDFQDVNASSLSKDGSEIFITDFNNFSVNEETQLSEWSTFIEEMNLDSSLITKHEIKVNDKSLYSVKFWKRENGQFTLKYVLFINNFDLENKGNWSGSIEINGSDLVILAKANIKTDSLEQLSNEDQFILSRIDMIVSSLEPLDPYL